MHLCTGKHRNIFLWYSMECTSTWTAQSNIFRCDFFWNNVSHKSSVSWSENTLAYRVGSMEDTMLMRKGECVSEKSTPRFGIGFEAAQRDDIGNRLNDAQGGRVVFVEWVYGQHDADERL